MIKSEKGSVTLLVGVTVLLIIIILSSSLMLVSLKRKSQLQESKILQEIYGGDNLDEIYQEQLEKKNYSNSSSVSILDITPDLYGKYVDYGIDLNENGIADDWKIFYQDETDRIFIISADYLNSNKYSSSLSKAEMKVGNAANCAYWDVAPSHQNIENNLDKKIFTLFIANDFNSNSNDYINSNMVSTLLNVSNWSELLDSNGFGEYAIGSPTIEMWVSSWNNRGYKKLYLNGENEYGYTIGTSISTSAGNIYINNEDNNGYNDALYFPYTYSYGSHGYWIASQSKAVEEIFRISYNGYVGGALYSASNFALRPVVCLKTGTGVTWDSEKEVFKLTSSPQTSPRKYRIAEGTTLKNSLTQGPATAEGIGANSAGTFTIDDKGMYINDTSNSRGCWIVYNFLADDGYSTSLNINHIYYTFVDANLVSASTGSLTFGFANGYHKNNIIFGVFSTAQGISTSTNGNYVRLSLFGKPTKAGNDTYENDYMDRLQFGVSNANIATGYLRNLMMLDLTAIFGEGNEPDKQWCDTNINFDTTIVTK